MKPASFLAAVILVLCLVASLALGLVAGIQHEDFPRGIFYLVCAILSWFGFLYAMANRG